MAFSEEQRLPDFTDWRGMYSSHPQSKLLMLQVERATQDIFFHSLSSGSNDLFYLLKDKSQMEPFLEKMLKYWEKKEEFERCSDIIRLGENLKKEWDNREDYSELTPEERLVNWIKSSF